MLLAMVVVCLMGPVFAEDGMDAPPPIPPVAETPPCVSTNPVDRSQMLYIKEYRVLGSHHLSRTEIEKAVYPFMGPERTTEDVEQARTALEKAIQDKGYCLAIPFLRPILSWIGDRSYTLYVFHFFFLSFP
jgi:hemolysin activation/secretion protein